MNECAVYRLVYLFFTPGFASLFFRTYLEQYQKIVQPHYTNARLKKFCRIV